MKSTTVLIINLKKGLWFFFRKSQKSHFLGDAYSPLSIWLNNNSQKLYIAKEHSILIQIEYLFEKALTMLFCKEKLLESIVLTRFFRVLTQNLDFFNHIFLDRFFAIFFFEKYKFINPVVTKYAPNSDRLIFEEN